MLKRIIKIKDFRIFKDYSWPSNLEDFEKLNVVYGWNGSGKTALSTLFRYLEDKKPINCGEFIIQTDEAEINENNVASSNLMIRVFNQDFIKENVFTPSNEVTPIFFLGKEDIKKIKDIQESKITFNRLKDEESKHISNFEIKIKQIDEMSINEAKRIKEYLRSNSVNVGLLFPSFVGVKIPKCVGIKFPTCVGIKIPNVLPESIWDVHARGRGVFYVTGSSA